MFKVLRTWSSEKLFEIGFGAGFETELRITGEVATAADYVIGVEIGT